ncbi:MAG TPA: diguanylate cyclase, partial [Pirellulales bacterium]|nr:diguanylate cyclase [Pirellulales bacterium]
MPAIQPPKVLLLSRDPVAVQGWAGALAAVAETVWLSAADVPNRTIVEVIVTDLPTAEEARDLIATALDGLAGVVGFGPAVWADVTLADDSAPCELALACRLLGEVARLRSDRERSVQIGHQIRALAYTDPLTGLANRRAWQEELAQRIDRPASTHSLCLALVDLDR